MRLRAAAVLVSVVALETWLLRGAPARLSGPAQPSWSALEGWYDAVGPTRAAAGALRGVGLLAGGWLLLALVLQVASATTSVPGLRRLADAISPRSLTRFGQGLAGLSLTAGLSLPAPGAGIPPPDAPVATTEVPGTATLSLVDPAPPPTSGPVPPDPTATPSPGEAPVPVPREGAEGEDQVVVEPGDSFWSLAAAEVGGRGPTDERTVARYWLRLIEANRPRLVDPSNPDLIYPGQRFLLPPP